MEEPTLARMKKLFNEQAEARRKVGVAEEEINALARGSPVNIDGMMIELLTDGEIAVTGRIDPDRGGALLMSERQIQGLVGWTVKNVGVRNRDAGVILPDEGKKDGAE